MQWRHWPAKKLKDQGELRTQNFKTFAKSSVKYHWNNVSWRRQVDGNRSWYCCLCECSTLLKINSCYKSSKHWYSSDSKPNKVEIRVKSTRKWLLPFWIVIFDILGTWRRILSCWVYWMTFLIERRRVCAAKYCPRTPVLVSRSIFLSQLKLNYRNSLGPTAGNFPALLASSRRILDSFFFWIYLFLQYVNKILQHTKYLISVYANYTHIRKDLNNLPLAWFKK